MLLGDRRRFAVEVGEWRGQELRRVDVWVAGPLRLLDGDYPGRDLMRAIAEGNLRAALALLP